MLERKLCGSLVVKPRRINDRHLAFYVLGSQALISLVLPLILLLIYGEAVAVAALCGGWIATIANMYFAVQAFRYSGASASSQMIKAFYRGETGKFVIVMLLFVVCFKFVEAIKTQAHVLILAFIVTQSVVWFAPLFLRKHQ